jgi:para-nitrobenzyl esterase
MINDMNRAARALRALLPLVLAGALAGCSGSDSNDVEAGAAPSSAARVNTAQGPVTGVEQARQISFKGIPYAATPIGERRFAPPQPTPPRDAALQADRFASPCPQTAGTFAEPSENEDCLYLNVYRPKTGDDHPVMVWIHGGAFVTGSGGSNYNPVRLVQKGMVVVTINYRLGALGFLAHPLLSAASADNGSGDYGLLDQQAALRWVQDNIDGFGGDPDNVTVFGESAGGHSVLSQVASPQAAGLFDRAIVQSGSYAPAQISLAQAEQLGAAIAAELGCDTLDCLRDAPVADVLAAQSDFSFIPNTRPTVLPNSIAQVIARGDFNPVPILMGTNRDEGQLFIAGAELARGAAFQEGEYRAQIAELIGTDADDPVVAVVAEYPLADYADTAHALAAAYTDARFACDGLAAARGLATTVNTYAYEFADRGAPSLLPPAPSFADYGAAHAYEIAYVINTESAMRERGAGDDQIALSNTMIDYWSSFARTGDPNPSNGVRAFWEPFASNDNYQELVAPEPRLLSDSDFSARHHCDFWQAFGMD